MRLRYFSRAHPYEYASDIQHRRCENPLTTSRGGWREKEGALDDVGDGFLSLGEGQKAISIHDACYIISRVLDFVTRVVFAAKGGGRTLITAYRATRTVHDYEYVDGITIIRLTRACSPKSTAAPIWGTDGIWSLRETRWAAPTT